MGNGKMRGMVDDKKQQDKQTKERRKRKEKEEIPMEEAILNYSQQLHFSPTLIFW
jgi:hypothetical protein